jgi:sortase A
VRRVLAAILIIVGLGLLAYPTLREQYFDYRQQQLLKAWIETQAVAAPPKVVVNPAIQGAVLETQDAVAPAPSPVHRLDPAREKYIQENMEGILVIDKIGLKIPVLREDTKENLNISVAHVAGTAGPGEAGNYCIAGHRMRTYGRHFNRLHEVSKGDQIKFIGPDATYFYRVFEVLVIPPEETWVLEPSEEETLITLITCDYSQKPSLRLVVRGQLVF